MKRAVAAGRVEAGEKGHADVDNLGADVDADVDGVDICPVCQEGVGQHHAVMLCGHCLCCKCEYWPNPNPNPTLPLTLTLTLTHLF